MNVASRAQFRDAGYRSIHAFMKIQIRFWQGRRKRVELVSHRRWDRVGEAVRYAREELSRVVSSEGMIVSQDFVVSSY